MQKLIRFVRKATRILVDRLRNQGVRVTLIWLYGRGFPKLTGIPLVQFSHITPDLWVGGQFGKIGKRKLERQGVVGDVNMRVEFDDAAHGLALAAYCHLPTVDDAAPTIAHLQQGADFMQRVIADGGSVYVHCAGGIGRAPTMAAAYLITQGYTLDEAVALIKQTRPFIRIMPPQWEQLKRFETLHRDGK
ncbi:MAG: dual specificity protein phosphatase family protein [Anaerolineae bacterium]|nr:dual specificity protein phosphatase family protein [Anaerolineae bacterium]